MRLFVFILFIFNQHCAYAQKKELIKAWAAGFTTNVALPGSAYIALQPCAEIQFQNRFSAVAGYSFKFIDVDKSETSVTNEKYGRFLVEGRYRLVKKENRASFYTSLQCTRSFRKYTQKDGYFLFEFDDDSTTYFTKADVNSPVTTLSLQLGFNSRGQKKIYIDIFAGMGVRFTNTRFYNIEGRTRQFNLFRKHYDWDSGLEVGKPASFLHLTAGLRFFYRLS
jgi:hypothetical protein